MRESAAGTSKGNAVLPALTLPPETGHLGWLPEP